MLALLNDIIEDPAEAEDLRRKIDESEFATGLVQRIHHAASRQRLGAPNVDGRGVGLDPNSVAEYLDNTLPPERIPDLERICVESDVHLAEVTACYQILAEYIRGPITVDPALADRIRRIALGEVSGHTDVAKTSSAAGPDEAVAAPAAAPIGMAPPPAAAPLPTPPQPTTVGRAPGAHAVPEYLRIGQRGRWRPLAVTLLAAFLLSAVALRAMGPFDRQHPLMRLFGMSPEANVASGRAATSSAADARTPAADAEATVPQTANEAADAVVPTAEPTEAARAESPDAATTRPADTQASSVEEVLPPVAPETPPAAERPRPPMPAEPPTESRGAGPDRAAASAARPEDAGGGAELDGRSDSRDMDGPPQMPQVDSPAAVAGEAVDVGYVKLSEPNFLVRYARESADWFRLPARTRLMSDDRLLVFPTYRPEIIMTPGVQIVFTGSSSVQTMRPSPQDEPGLTIHYGRALIAMAGAAGARIHLDLSGHKGTITFHEAASEIGVEVSHFLPPGVDPERVPAWPVIRLSTTIGRIDWLPTGATAAVALEQGQVHVMVGDQTETLAATQPPAWMQGTEVRDVDRLASDTLEPFITPDRPVSLILRERTEDRKSEVRSLAARGLACLDTFESLIKEFGDDRQRAYWSAQFSALRESLVRGPETAAQIRKTFEAYCGGDAAELYRLSWGYSPEQLAEGAAQHLVDLLDHDSLRVRVFAFENLQRITKKTLLYLPATNAATRKSSIQRWKEQLRNGAIVYETPPSPLEN